MVEGGNGCLGQAQRGLGDEAEDIERRGDVEVVHVHRLVAFRIILSSAGLNDDASPFDT